MKIIQLSWLNDQAVKDPKGLVEACEDAYARKIDLAADQIKERASTHPVVVLSGPSGSGKTTSARRIEHRLEEMGVNSHTISMDDYFLSRDEYPVPKDEEGNDDLESPLCVDWELLNRHIALLAQGREVAVPQFNFTTQRRDDVARPLRLARDEIVVMEGIHALNPLLLDQVGRYATGVYVSMRTRIERPDHELIGPEHLRVVRRIVRDAGTRNRTADQTIEAWKSVRRGEMLYIMPHKENADISIDTFIPYEPCVTTHLAAPLLTAMPEEAKTMGEGEIICSLPSLFATLPVTMVPDHSLLNEFLGK